MPRYIDGDALIARIRRHKERVKSNDEFLNKVYGLAHEHIIEIIEDEFPAADVEEVKHGEWIEQYDEDEDPLFRRKWFCSVCGDWQTYGVTKRCSECGAITSVQGHHSDYSRPFDVEWLCSLCHGKKHRKEVLKRA